MAASGSRDRGQGSAAGAGAVALDTLTNPDLVHLPAVDLVARLRRADRSESDFADVALVLAARERRLVDAEDRIRAADVVAAGLRDTIRKLEIRAANAEALARNSLGSGGIVWGERAVASCVDHQSQAGLEPQIGVPELPAGEIEADAGVKAARAEVGVVDPRGEISEAVAGKRKQEPAAASEQQPLEKKPKPAHAFDLNVATEESETQDEEAQGWEMLNQMKAQVAAWELEYGVADAATQGTLQAEAAATPPMAVEEVQTVDEARESMASGSRGHGKGSAGAGADDALDSLTNPGLAHLPAPDLVVHLHRDDRCATDFADIALVLAVRERRLAEAEDRVREAEVLADCRECRVAEAETRARAAEVVAAGRERWLTEAEARAREAELVAAGLRDTIRALELKLRAANIEVRLPRDRTVAGQAAGDHLTASDIGAADDLTGGEITPGVCFEAGVMATPPAEVEDNTPCPSPLMTIYASPDPLPDELIEETAAVEVERVVADVAVPRSYDEVAPAEVVDCRDKVSEAIVRKRKEPASDLSQSLADLVIRVTGHNVLEKETHGEDMTASPHRCSQVEQPARATKKARKQKGTSFHTMVLKALMEKQNFLRKKEEEDFAKRAAATVIASKQPCCKCWSDAPYFPSKSAAVDDDSDSESSEN